MSIGWDIKWCPVSGITTPLARKDFDEEQAHEGRQGNFKLSELITFN